MLQEIRTIQQFYALMKATWKVRRRQVARIMRGKSPGIQDCERLAAHLDALRAIPRRDGRFELTTGRIAGGGALYLELDYEIGELQKDLIFLRQGEEALLAHLQRLHSGFQDQLAAAIHFCAGMQPESGCLISDRDGTVNNYCGRYLSSVQSSYNAVFLCRFAARMVRHAVILSSAPLSGGGLEELTVSPAGWLVLAGSKGREYLDEKARRGALAIEPQQQRQLDRLNRRLAGLLQQPRYELFALIGSGLQFKFGQTTVARQDIYGSIPAEESERFAELILDLIREIDPDGRCFRSEDTGKDIEIILTLPDGSGFRDFDKGDGIRFLDSELSLHLDRGGNLVCGDTASDIPMITAAAACSPDLWTIFVSEDAVLKEAVRHACPRAHFVSQPDILVSVFNALAQDGK